MIAAARQRRTRLRRGPHGGAPHQRPAAARAAAASTMATMPSATQVAREPKASMPAARPNRPANAIPMPTPAKTCPDHSSLPWRARIGIAHADVPTSTKALADAGQEPQRQPQRLPIGKSHRQREQPDREETPADRGRGSWRQRDAKQRADQIAEIIAGGEPAADGERQPGILLHQRQDRRQRKAPDPHGAGKRQQPDQGGARCGRLDFFPGHAPRLSGS